MSMLSAQADELRTLADKLRCVRFDGEWISNAETLYLSMGAMREAAYTIEGLRDRLQELQGVTGESRYTALFGTPERAARMLANVCQFTHGGEMCDRCQCYLFGDCDGTLRLKSERSIYDALLEWLRGDAE